MLRLLSTLGFSLILCFNVFAGVIRLDDEGTKKGYIAILNCTGSGVSCTKSGITGTLNAPNANFGSSIDDTELTAEDFGDFTCTGAEDGCSVNATHSSSAHHTRSHTVTSTSDHTANTWKILYSNGSGEIIELALGATAGHFLKTNGAAAAPTFAAAAGGAAEISVLLKPQSAKLPTSNPAVIDAGNSGWRLLYDDTTQEFAAWEFILDDDYGAGTLYCDVFFSMLSGEADEVQFEAYVMAVTATTDNADWDTDSYDTENVGVTTVAATAGRPYKQTITLTNDDSLAAGDMIRIKISTDSDDAVNDDATGDREFRYAVIRE